MFRIGIFVCVTLPLFYPVLCRRNLSSIRYHFTPCGRTGRDGPTYDMCKQYYTSIDSPIIRDGTLTDTHSEKFVGSQSFRPPRETRYNLTIAGAAGGKGLCNFEHGHGLIVYTHAVLNATTDYLVLVGQKGLGPCDSEEKDHILCNDPPQDANSSAKCRDNYLQWLQNQTDLNFERTLDLSGGAGGGGASYLGQADLRLGVDVRVFGLPGGGGGSSCLLNYSSVQKLFSNSALKGRNLYLDFLNGNSFLYNPYIADNIGIRGYRINVNPSTVTAGAGGGALSDASYPLNQQDGRTIGRSEDFALGGTHCALNDLSDIPTVLRGGNGGFGGGGGGCGGGGGGGGFTGGAILGAENTIPGGGGYTLAFHMNTSYVASDDAFNEGDGYVDIVAADCGCVYDCVVYEEEDQFECICPNSTLLAPDLNDCYYNAEQDVNVSISTLINGFQFQLLHTGNTTVVYGIHAVLNTVRNDDSCAIAFLGEDRREIVTVSEPIQGSGEVTTLAMTTLNFTDGSFHLSSYFDWLPEPQIITGGILISTGHCSIENNTMNISVSLRSEFTSAQEIRALQYADESALQDKLVSNKDIVARFAAAALRIMPSNDTTSDVVLTNVEFISIIVASVLVLLAIISLAIGIVVYYRKRRTKGKYEISETATPSRLWSGTSDSNMLNNNRYAVANRHSSSAPQNHALAILADDGRFSNTDYEVLSYELIEQVVSNHPSQASPTSAPRSLPSPTSLQPSIHETIPQISSKFGHLAPIHDFVGYNRSRANSSVKEWQYPRSSLVYLRELGEGAFGKVLLMKTQGIAGYSGSIPVAVKTLNSRDPDKIHKFLEEAELMKKFSHPNIVSILGVCTDDVDKNSAPLMILEYMPYGDLLSFLQTYKPTQKDPNPLITEDHFFSFAVDVAKALEFLAKLKFVHRDIAARNCLVGPNLVVKIADFGLARGVHDKDYYRVAGKQLLPVRSMSPESLLFGVFSTAGDVWSYGVLLWEIVSYGDVPLVGFTTESIIEEAHKQTLKHFPPPECPLVLSSLISQCHIHDPDQRPSFTDILNQLGCSLSASQ